MLLKYELSEAFEKRSSDGVRKLVHQVRSLNEAIENETNDLRRNWARQTDEQNNLITKTTKKTLAFVEGIRGVRDALFEQSTGGFIKIANDRSAEDDGTQLQPIMTDADQENIK